MEITYFFLYSHFSYFRGIFIPYKKKDVKISSDMISKKLNAYNYIDSEKEFNSDRDSNAQVNSEQACNNQTVTTFIW